MASVFFTQGREQIALQNLSLTGETKLKLILVDSTYAPSTADNFLTDGGGASAHSHEISVTGYTGGFNGSGRVVPSLRSFERNDGLARTAFHFDTTTWTALGAGATIGGAALIVEKTSDSDSWLVAFWATNSITTNGSDIVFQVSAVGALLF